MSHFAYFDEDGMCVGIHNRQLLLKDVKNAKYVGTVPEGVSPSGIYFSGGKVFKSEPSKFRIESSYPKGRGEISIPLPSNTLAIVNGIIQKTVVKIPLEEPQAFRVELRGAEFGSYTTEVLSYADQRRDAYPPVEEQLDAYWKGGAEEQAMRDRIMAIKASYPKS